MYATNTKQHYDAIIIGVGLSGLSAAVELALLGKKVLLLEKKKYCGGRTYSFLESQSKTEIDNGQHILLGCYQSTLRFLKIIGSDIYLNTYPSLQIKYLQPFFIEKFLKCPNTIWPLNLFFGLLTFDVLNMTERFKVLKVFYAIIKSKSIDEENLDNISAEEWLCKNGQTANIRKYLWDVIIIGALNNTPKNVSALIMVNVLKKIFFHKNGANIIIPKENLNTIFVEPAINYLQQHNCNIKTNVEVKIQSKNNALTSVKIDNNIFVADKYIIAVPWHALNDLLKNSNIDADSVIATKSSKFSFDDYTPSTIISIHLWINKQIMLEEYVALINSNIQWIFNKSFYKNDNYKNENIKQYLSIVISNANELQKLSSEKLTEIALLEIKNVFKDAKDLKVIYSKVIKEKRATFLPKQKLNNQRPLTETKYPNLFLAGDWINTGYPSTIEGAILSGKNAAKLL